MNETLYLPSTPLNVLVSAAVALQHKSEKSLLWMIDQKRCENSPYLKALQQWTESPFYDLDCLPERIEGLGKKSSRQRIFHKLVEKLHGVAPSKVCVGSDRRVEFQFIMQYLQNRGESAEGVYLDDGLYTYAGRPFVWWKDWVNAVLKNINYGFWWKEPSTVGASSWISSAWVFQPEYVYPALRTKKLQHMPVGWFMNNAIQGLSQKLFAQFDLLLSEVQQLDAVILIPHPNNLSKMLGYEEQLKCEIKKLLSQGMTLAVKYHPRTEQKDPLGLLPYGANVLLPKRLAFEFILPALRPGSIVQGDVGTAILTARWLRPDLNVRSVLNMKDPFQSELEKTLVMFNVPIKKV